MKFEYKAFDRAGAPADGTVDAEGESEAREALRRQGVFVVKLKPAGATAAAGTKASRFGGGRRLRNVAIFTRQLYVLVSTGTPLVDALAALERQAKEPDWRSIVSDVRAKVEQGSSLAGALAGHPRYFNAVCRGLVAAGESGGNLDAMLDRLASLTRKQMHVRNSVIGALIYPLLLVFVSVSVLVALLTFVLPRFTLLFKTLDTPLPPTTKWLMVLSDLTCNYWWAMLLGIAGAGAGVFAWVATPAGKRAIDAAAVSLPQIGPIVRNFATARIARLLGILLQGRVPLTEALALTRESMGNARYAQLVGRASDAVTRGDSLASAFGQTRLVPPSVYEAMRSGERSGQLGSLMSTIADFLDEENEVTLRSLTSILEPMILVVLGVLVGFVAISMFMPLFDLTAATRGGN